MKLFRKAILIVHGFAGGVYDQEYLQHQLELVNNYDVYSFTLPGHDGDTSKKITYESWVNRAEEMVEFLILNGYDNIYVVGHSMGGVIAAYLASKYYEIKKVVLVAPAFRYVSHEEGHLSVINAVKNGTKVLETYGAKMIANRMTKLPANAVPEFMKLVKKYQDCVNNISKPILLVRGTKDDIVPMQSINHVYDNVKSKYKKIILLKDTTHDVFRENKKEEITKYIIKFFKNKYSMDLFPELIEKDIIKK